MPSLLSIFTPTNSPTYLGETFDSILAQDYENYEWVIVPNGNMTTPIPPKIASHPKVRVCPDPKTDKIGALKKYACSQCRGDAYIELDHDDLLVPGTLAKIAKAIANGAGFVYSDVAVFKTETLDSYGYHPNHGWQSYPLQVYGKSFVASKCFPLTPRMLCEVYYAPDHVRCWHKSAYVAAGGHDASLAVGDDHDLICRTYLSGAKFHYLNCCGYLYRVHPSNTVKLRNSQIQAQQRINRRKYLHLLLAEWCKRKALPVVQLLNVWKDGKWKPGQTLPFDDASIGHLVIYDVLQFLSVEQQVPLFNEAFRVLVPEGFLSLVVPSEAGRYASQDPRHKTRFNLNSFLYYTDARFATHNPDIKCRFQVVENFEMYPDNDFKQHQMRMIQADLCRLGAEHHPAPQLI